MRRFGKILCGFGAIEFVCAALVLFIFAHMPYPWGTGTLPGGMIGLGEEDRIEATENWQEHFVVVAFGTGLSGLAFLVVGAVAYGLSRLVPPARP